MSNDWYKNGDLPPVGSVVELLLGGVSQGEIEIISYRNNGNTVVFWWLDKNYVDAAGLPSADFCPLRTETDKLVEQAKAICKLWDDSCGKSIPKLFVEANWRPIKPMSENEFVAQICISFDVDEEFCRRLYQGGCRFIK